MPRGRRRKGSDSTAEAYELILHKMTSGGHKQEAKRLLHEADKLMHQVSVYRKAAKLLGVTKRRRRRKGVVRRTRKAAETQQAQ